MKVPIFPIDAFAEAPFRGDPAVWRLADIKRAPMQKEDLPQLEEIPIHAEVSLSEELLAQKLADDFCEFGSSERIGEHHRG